MDYHPDRRMLAAFAIVVSRMQISNQELAYHAIAYILDWSDRAKIWEAAGLRPIHIPRLCKHEPLEP